MAGVSIFKMGNNMDVWATTLCLLLVVVITIAFESLLHHFEHWIQHAASDITSEVYMQMLQKLYKELMILGFISFVLTMLLQTKTITDITQIVSFEYAHFMIFFMALSLIFQAVAITATAYIVKRRCQKSQNTSLVELHEKVVKYKARTLPLGLWFDVCFELLNVLFIASNELPSDLSFAMYYGMVQDRIVVATMDIDITSWCTFLMILFTNVILQRILLDHDVPEAGSNSTNITSTTNVTSSGLSAARMLLYSHHSPCAPDPYSGGVPHRNLAGDSGSYGGGPAPHFERSVIEFAICGWALVGVLMFAVIWARGILSKMLQRVFDFVNHDNSKSFAHALLSANTKMEEYKSKHLYMSHNELKNALLKIQEDKIKHEHENEHRIHDMTAHSMHLLKDNVAAVAVAGVHGVGHGVEHGMKACNSKASLLRSGSSKRLTPMSSADLLATEMETNRKPLHNTPSLSNLTVEEEEKAGNGDTIPNTMMKVGQLKPMKIVPVMADDGVMVTKAPWNESKSPLAAGGTANSKVGCGPPVGMFLSGDSTSKDSTNSTNSCDNSISVSQSSGTLGESGGKSDDNDSSDKGIRVRGQDWQNKTYGVKAGKIEKRLSLARGGGVSIATMSNSNDKNWQLQRGHKHVGILNQGHSLVSSFELHLFTKVIDMLMLLNCAYIGIFICTFADPTPQLDQGAIYTLIAVLPAVLNVAILIPTLIFCFSLVSAVCKLDTAVLGTVLERGEEVTLQMLDLQVKISNKLKQRGDKPDALRALFHEYDSDDSGSVEKSEFRNALHSLNIFPSQASLDRLFRAMDSNQNGQVEYEEFAKALENDDEEATNIERQMHLDLASKDSPEVRKRYLHSLMRTIMEFDSSCNAAAAMQPSNDGVEDVDEIEII